jgi:3-dehydroquinate dehydratase-2
MKIAIIHGPNLDLLGKREPEVYGTDTLEDIDKEIEIFCKNNKIDVDINQFNSEGDIVSYIGSADCNAFIINPAAYTHTSVAIADAFSAVDKPVVEVHLSNIYKREGFRHKSMIAPVVIGQISGFGKLSYILAVQYFKEVLSE